MDLQYNKNLQYIIKKCPKIDWVVALWLVFGVIFVSFLGAVFHFVYEWSGENYWVAPFVATNESVWEHMKLAFWPWVIFAVIVYFFIRQRVNNYMSGVTEGIFLTLLLIPTLYYIYNYFFDDNLIADIIIFVISISLGFLLMYYILKSLPLPREWQVIAYLTLFVFGSAFIAFTYCPPTCDLFRSPVNGKYGLDGYSPTSD